jgi:hypothetical protein
MMYVTSQMVRIPRLTTPKRIVYAVVPTWRNCGLLVGDTGSFRATVLQNADEHITRFIDAWQFANAPPPDPAFPALPELGMAGESFFSSPSRTPPGLPGSHQCLPRTPARPR